MLVGSGVTPTLSRTPHAIPQADLDWVLHNLHDGGLQRVCCPSYCVGVLCVCARVSLPREQRAVELAWAGRSISGASRQTNTIVAHFQWDDRLLPFFLRPIRLEVEIGRNGEG